MTPRATPAVLFTLLAALLLLACGRVGFDGALDGSAGIDAPGLDAPRWDVALADTSGLDVSGADTAEGDAPVSDAPVSDAPVSDAPGSDAPVSDAPGSDAPGSDAGPEECGGAVCPALTYCDFGVCTRCFAGHPCRLSASSDFSGLRTRTTANGQDGWRVTGPYDQEVVDDGTGNLVWRVSNAVASGNFGDQPYAPCPAGVPSADVRAFARDNHDWFAGESAFGVTYDRFATRIRFRSATGAYQPGLSVTMSIDPGNGSRMTLVTFEDLPGGISVSYDNVVDSGPIASGLSFSDWHTVIVELSYLDGPANDTAKYDVAGTTVTSGSWERYFAGIGDEGYPVQCTLFRLSTPAPTVMGGGYFFDDYIAILETL